MACASIAGCASDSEHVVELSTPEETPLALPLIPTHPTDGDPTFTVTTEPEHGTLEGAFPTAVYTPAADFNGEDKIVVRVDDGDGTVDLTLRITVTPTNDGPIANADVVTGSEDTTQTIPASMLLANDEDIDGDELTITAVRMVRFGTATVEDGNVVFSPSANFNGGATLLYTVSDGQATATGVITISIGAVADAPIAMDDWVYTDFNTPITIGWLLGNDSDPDGQSLTITAVSDAQNGTATLDNGDVTFVPATDFTGDATFSYTISDGALTATASCTVNVGPPPSEEVSN